MTRRHYLRIGLATAAATIARKLAAASPDDPLRLLFIGNSYTIQNNLPLVFARLVESEETPEKRKVETGLVARGGYSLAGHWRDGDAQKAIGGSRWDYVVLQEQSLLNGGKLVEGVPRIPWPTEFSEASRSFGREIRKAQAKTVFYLTWSRKRFPEMQSKLTEAYRTAARELGAILAPVGPAFQNARIGDPALELYRPDESHPSPAGTYLAACVFFASIFRRSPEGLASRFVIDRAGGKAAPMETQVPDELAAYLQTVAWHTVESDPSFDWV